jgi:hypothetical protein
MTDTPVPDKPATPGPDKHTEARMARIEAAVQRLQLFVVAITSVGAILWCLDIAGRIVSDPEAGLVFYGAQLGGALVGVGLAYAAAKLIGYPLQILKRA